MTSFKTNVSVIVMTKNEEKNISKCLKSLLTFDEIFVVDSLSDDRTCEIASHYDVKIVNFDWNGKYPKKKQWCLTNLPIKSEWVLYVDADEEMAPELAAEIDIIVNTPAPVNGYFVGFNYYFLGKALLHGHRVYKLVLFKKDCGRFIDYDDLDVQNMWEVEGHYQPEINGDVGVLKHKMLHNDHENLFHFIEKINKYSDWESALICKNKLRHPNQSSLKIRKIAQKISGLLPFKGFFIFIYSFIFRLGFLDGFAGFYYAVALGIYYFMIDMKTYEIKLNKENIL